jgi:transcriptional regulator with XRE-family HTH domain
MRVEEAIGRQVAGLRAQRQLSLADLGEALGRYLGKPWSRQAVHQAERGQRSFTAAELTALALALDTSVQALFRAEDEQIELAGRAISAEEYRGILLNRQNDTPLDGLEELIVALHDIGEVLERPALARMARIARAAERVPTPPLDLCLWPGPGYPGLGSPEPWELPSGAVGAPAKPAMSSRIMAS